MLSVIEKPPKVDQRFVLTASRLQTFLQCERYHYHRYVQGYSEKEQPKYLTFGKMWHKGLEEFYKTKTFDDPVGNTLNAKAVLPLEAKRWGLSGFEFETQCDIAALLLDKYAEHWRDDNFVTIAVEKEFLIDLPTMAFNYDKKWKLAGKIDAIVAHKPSGLLFVVEHKSVGGDVDLGGSYWANIGFNYQISMYMLAARQLGIDVCGVVYDAMRKPSKSPQLATDPKKRKFKKNGEPYAHVRLCDETPREYLERVKEELNDSDKQWFNRVKTTRSQEQLDYFVNDVLYKVCARIERGVTVENTIQNPERCRMYGNRMCPFIDVCCGGDIEAVDKIEKGKIFPELEIL